MSMSSSCAVPTPPTVVSATVTGCDSAEVTWGASTFLMETIQNYSVMYQRISSSDPIMVYYAPSTSYTLQDLQPNATYAVSVAGINSCGGTSEFTSTIFQLQGKFKFMECHVTVCYCPYTHTNQCCCNTILSQLRHCIVQTMADLFFNVDIYSHCSQYVCTTVMHCRSWSSNCYSGCGWHCMQHF